MTLDKVYKLARQQSRSFPNEFPSCKNHLTRKTFSHIIIFQYISYISHLFTNTALFWPLLTRLWIQSDNTVKEVRNGNAGKLCSVLLQGQTFSCVSHNHLVVGHTHEDIDGIFSLVTTALASESILLSPRDVQRCIQKKIAPMFEENGMVFSIEFVEREIWFRIGTF